MKDVALEPQRYWPGDTVELVNSGRPPATGKVVDVYTNNENKWVYVLKGVERPVEAREIALIVPGAQRKALA